MADVAAAERMSLVELMGALTERGVDIAGMFDKTALLQRLVEELQAEAPVAPPPVADQGGLLQLLADGATPRPHDLLVVGNVKQRQMMEDAMGRAIRMADEPEPEPEPEPELQELTVNGLRLASREVMGQTIWPSATVLAEAIAGVLEAATADSESCEGDARPCALEIGAGAGLPSLAAARAGYDVVATDFDDGVLDTIALNARLNNLQESAAAAEGGGKHPLRPRRGLGGASAAERAALLASGGGDDDPVLGMVRSAQGARLSRLDPSRGCCRARCLDWKDPADIAKMTAEFGGKFDVVYGSDVVYTAHDIRPLVQCAAALLKRRCNAPSMPPFLLPGAEALLRARLWQGGLAAGAGDDAQHVRRPLTHARGPSRRGRPRPRIRHPLRSA